MTGIPSVCRAVVLSDFGDASQLNLRLIPTPELSQPDAVLVRVHATSVNPIEWKMRQGMAGIHLVGRRVLGDPMILGLDFSGEVAAVGPNVVGFRVGEAVFG